MAVVKRASYDTYFGTAAERIAIVAPVIGDKFFETDTGLLMWYTGTAWQEFNSGLSQLTASRVDLQGLAVNRPAANSVAVGVTYWAVDTGVVEVSTGVVWVVI